jgi:hypothetical protein
MFIVIAAGAIIVVIIWYFLMRGSSPQPASTAPQMTAPRNGLLGPTNYPPPAK